MERKDAKLKQSIKTNGKDEAHFCNCNYEKELKKLNEKIDQVTLNLAAVRYKLGDLKRNNLDTYVLVQKICVVVETIEHNITHIPSDPWKDKMTSYGKDVPITSIAENHKQFSKNESSDQNFMRKGDEVGMKKIEVKKKINDACDENLSLKNLFTCRKLKQNQILYNVNKKDKATDGVDFVDLGSSVELNTVESKKVRHRKPSRYQKSPYENFLKKRGRRNKEFGSSKHGAPFSEEEWYILQYCFHEQLDKRYEDI